MGERTVLIIAHRLSSIRSCDEIHVLKNGQQMEYGSFDQLMEKSGIFRVMVESQEL